MTTTNETKKVNETKKINLGKAVRIAGYAAGTLIVAGAGYGLYRLLAGTPAGDVVEAAGEAAGEAASEAATEAVEAVKSFFR